jgi:hypothetical protein
MPSSSSETTELLLSQHHHRRHLYDTLYVPWLCWIFMTTTFVYTLSTQSMLVYNFILLKAIPVILITSILGMLVTTSMIIKWIVENHDNPYRALPTSSTAPLILETGLTTTTPPATGGCQGGGNGGVVSSDKICCTARCMLINRFIGMTLLVCGGTVLILSVIVLTVYSATPPNTGSIPVSIVYVAGGGAITVFSSAISVHCSTIRTDLV